MLPEGAVLMPPLCIFGGAVAYLHHAFYLGCVVYLTFNTS